MKYAEEADILNVVLFNTTSLNPELAKTSNIRDYAVVIELIVLSNLESYNAELIKDKKAKKKGLKY